ncbi:G-protein alpha subunit [Mucidula mucida]|nr:G-protein alpha subunit [Mucidula mucida]
MGQCASVSQDQARSDDIDKQLEVDGRQFKRECKILLLGSGESGKSTIVKQMKIIHQGGFTHDELDAYKPIIFRNVMESAVAIVQAMQKLGISYAAEENQVIADKVLSHGANEALTAELASALHVFVQDTAVCRVLDEHASEFYLMDSAEYFFAEILRIGAPRYRPNETDVLRARATTTAITETRFMMGNLEIHMFDVGGQRSERRKWIHCFESVTSIIFCMALSEYSQVLLPAEDPSQTQNRLTESLVLFSSVVNSRWFLRTSIVLFLNKKDVFKEKIKRGKIPLERYFPEYNGGRDVNKAAKYILWRFMKENRARLSVYPHLTQATDTDNIRFVFTAVKETILQNALKDSGIL